MTDQQGSPTLGKVAPWTRLEAELAGLDKLMLEVHFGKHLRRVQVVSPAELDELLGDILSLSDLGQVLDLDLVVAGTLRESPGPQS